MMCPKVSSLHTQNLVPVYADENDQTIESPVSRSLSDAVLQVSQSKVKMDQFLRQQSSESYYQDDNDDMSTELRMLKSSEEKLRNDMERIENYEYLPQLACPSDCDSQELSEESITSQHFKNDNICCRLYDSFNNVKDGILEIPELELENDYEELVVSRSCESVSCDGWNEAEENTIQCHNLIDTIASMLFGSSKTLYTKNMQVSLCVLTALIFMIRNY